MALVKSEKSGETYDDEDLGSLLFYCAKLRGVTCLPHRTLREFDWFVSIMIFYDHEKRLKEIERYVVNSLRSTKMTAEGAAQWRRIAIEEANHERETHDRYRRVYDEGGAYGDLLVKYARAFVQYCEDEYGWWNNETIGL